MDEFGGVVLSRKWMWYYVGLILVFLIGRYAMIGFFQLDQGIKDWERYTYFAWVNGFSLLFLGPAFWYAARRWIQVVKEKIPSKGLRIFTLSYSMLILFFLFVVVYYGFLLSF